MILRKQERARRGIRVDNNGYLQNLLWIGMATALLVFGLAASVSFLEAEDAVFPATSCLVGQPDFSPSFDFCGEIGRDLVEIRSRPGGLYDPNPGNRYQDMINRARAADDDYLAAYLLALRAASGANPFDGDPGDEISIDEDAIIADANQAIEMMIGENLAGAGLIRALGYTVLGESALVAGKGGVAADYYLRAEQDYRDPGSGAALYAAAAVMEMRSKYDLHLADYSAALGHADDAARAYVAFGLPEEASRVLFRLAYVASPTTAETALALAGAGERYGCERDRDADPGFCQFAKESAAAIRQRISQNPEDSRGQ